MSVIVVDILCGVLVLVGLGVALIGANVARPSEASSGGRRPAPAAYLTRIVGVMMAAFGLAFGAMFTAFSIAQG